MDILNFFSNEIQFSIQKKFPNIFFDNIEEIRLRNGRNIVIRLSDSEIVIDYIVTTEDLLKTLEKITENSIYTYQNQICNGFITVKGGHRVGISGNVAIENNRVVNITHVYSINFRVAREINGCGDFLIKHIYNNFNIYNTLILGAPGSGKTTALKDVIRIISDGENLEKGYNVGLIDERSEISAMYKGLPQVNLGLRTDILENVPKKIGIKMMIRSMAPEVIAVDEIGGIDDAESINYAMCSGVKGIFTAHGNGLQDLKNNPELNKLFNMKIIERILVLSGKVKGKLSKAYYLNKDNYEYSQYL